METGKTTQLSGLTDYELSLEKCIDEIRNEKSTLLAIRLLDRFIHKNLSEHQEEARNVSENEQSKEVCRTYKSSKWPFFPEPCDVCGGYKHEHRQTD